jgi:protein-S-isoprenylcysteine O-methyltransferase Ste14
MAMGDAWRIGVDPEERTELVTEGPLAMVRNPIYSAMIPTVLGLVLMVPNVLAIGAIVAIVVAIELQVRLVEEPYLAARCMVRISPSTPRASVRFVPGVGSAGAR